MSRRAESVAVVAVVAPAVVLTGAAGAADPAADVFGIPVVSRALFDPL